MKRDHIYIQVRLVLRANRPGLLLELTTPLKTKLSTKNVCDERLGYRRNYCIDGNGSYPTNNYLDDILHRIKPEEAANTFGDIRGETRGCPRRLNVSSRVLTCNEPLSDQSGTRRDTRKKTSSSSMEDSNVNSATYNLAKTPLNAAQAPLATAKKIHCVRMLHELVLPTRRLLASVVIADSDLEILGSSGFVDAAAFLRCRAMV